MEHLSEIEEGVLPGSSGLKRADPKILHGINQKIHHLPPLLPEACIFRVHDGLRKVNEEAYTPMLVSIGPYHHGNPKLRAMEEHKLRYLRSLLERKEENSAERYLLLMETLEDRPRGYYADPICLMRDNFVEMMLLDACFIIEFLRKLEYEYLQDEDDPIFKSSWMKFQIIRDMMLLENQLPFFVLSELFKMTKIPDSKNTLLQLSSNPIYQMLPGKSFSILSNHPAHESKHFLDLLHNVCRPSCGEASSNKTSMSCNKNYIQMPCLTELLHNVRLRLFGEASSNKTSMSGNKNSIQMPCLTKLLHNVRLRLFGEASSNKTCVFEIPCVTELQEAGISFKVNKSKNARSLFDINFECGHLKIPKFRVDDLTETFFRNIIAFEQHSSDVTPKYFTDYTTFMDILINTEKDVNTLRLCGIIKNLLGDDDEVARMFNKLGDGIIFDESTYYYSQVCQKLNDHCGKCWNKAKAKLRRNYFHNPWASISTIAAIFLILLTLIQTVSALITLIS